MRTAENPEATQFVSSMSRTGSRAAGQPAPVQNPVAKMSFAASTTCARKDWWISVDQTTIVSGCLWKTTHAWILERKGFVYGRMIAGRGVQMIKSVIRQDETAFKQVLFNSSVYASNV